MSHITFAFLHTVVQFNIQHMSIPSTTAFNAVQNTVMIKPIYNHACLLYFIQQTRTING